MLVVFLIGLLFIREPHVQHWDESFLRWLLDHSRPAAPAVPLTVVELGVDSVIDRAPGPGEPPLPPPGQRVAAVSPVEFALFLQSVLEFHPDVVAFENILRWRERDKDQEVIFLDQAMRVPKLLLATELSSTPEPDAPAVPVQGFTQVKGKRGDLAEFSGIGRQPNEDMQLISTRGAVNLPDEVAGDTRVPLLFLYHGDVIPSFTLQAILLWLKVTPPEVKIDLDSHIELPDGRRIPINRDGTILIYPAAAKNARRLTLNELLLATDQRDGTDKTSSAISDLHNQIVLARMPANPLSPPDVFAAAIATVQANLYLRPAPKIFDVLVLLAIVGCVALVRKFDTADIVLCGIAFTAAYCLIALGVIAQWQIWLPGCLPFGAVWLIIIITIIVRRQSDPEHRPANMTLPPPIA